MKRVGATLMALLSCSCSKTEPRVGARLVTVAKGEAPSNPFVDMMMSLSGDAQETANEPDVGLILMGVDLSSATARGSGTLVRCDTVLTAEHVFQTRNQNERVWVWFQRTGAIEMKSPKETRVDNLDLAYFDLRSDIQEIKPRALGSTKVPRGSNVTLVGFGRGDGGSPPGIERELKVFTRNCQQSNNDPTSTCWQYDGHRNGGSICGDDSGGPLLYKEQLASVAKSSWANLDQCGNEDTATATDIQSALTKIPHGARTPACPDYREPDSVTFLFSDDPDGSPADAAGFTVPPNATRVVVTLSAEQSGISYDLSVVSPDGSTPCSIDHSPKSREVCVVEHPQAGGWKASATYSSDPPGVFQIVASVWR